MSAETVRHSSTYITLYIYNRCRHHLAAVTHVDYACGVNDLIYASMCCNKYAVLVGELDQTLGISSNLQGIRYIFVSRFDTNYHPDE